MATTLPLDDDEPIVPAAADARLLDTLRRALGTGVGRSSGVQLVTEGAAPADVPESILDVLRRAVRELAVGNAVTVLPIHDQLTTQEAADLLNVSRPYLIGLLDKGEIAYTRTAGGHRRLNLADVLRYKRVRDVNRRAALDEMSAEAERLGLEY